MDNEMVVSEDQTLFSQREGVRGKELEVQLWLPKIGLLAHAERLRL